MREIGFRAENSEASVQDFGSERGKKVAEEQERTFGELTLSLDGAFVFCVSNLEF